MKRFLTAAGMVGALLLTAAPVSWAAGAVNTRTPFVSDWFNACTGENVRLSGVVHIVSRGGTSELPPYDGPHGFHFSVRARGEADTGARYVLQDVQNVQTTFPEGFPGVPPPPPGPGAQVYNAVVRIKLIRLGRPTPADTYQFLVNQHVTWDANGNVTANRLEITESC